MKVKVKILKNLRTCVLATIILIALFTWLVFTNHLFLEMFLSKLSLLVI